MKVNSEAIYGTTAGPFDFDFEWGAISQKPQKLYLHVLKWDPAGIACDGLKTKLARAYLLTERGRPLAVEQAAGRVRIIIPAQAPDPNVSVIVLALAGPVQIDEHATGTVHWTKKVDIRLNQEKIARQKAAGWMHNKLTKIS